MKRILLAVFALALPMSAAASPELATDWGIKASQLYGETVDLIEAVEAGDNPAIPSDYETGIARFALAATNLGSWIDGNDGPSDLGCIFRGMAQEGEVQLDALETADNRQDMHASLKRLATMFSDAEIIAAAASASAGNDTPAKAPDGVMASCAASSDAANAALH